jgi:hypothetical protein
MLKRPFTTRPKHLFGIRPARASQQNGRKRQPGVADRAYTGAGPDNQKETPGLRRSYIPLVQKHENPGLIAGIAGSGLSPEFRLF